MGIAPPMRRCSFAALMTGKPTLQEPVFLVEITCPMEAMSGVYSCMNLRRGCVFEENEREGTPLRQVKAYLPVAESFGFVAPLRQHAWRCYGGRQSTRIGPGHPQEEEPQGGDA